MGGVKVGRGRTSVAPAQAGAGWRGAPLGGVEMPLGALSAVALGLSLFPSDGLLDPVALGGVSFATLAALLAMIAAAAIPDPAANAGRRWTLGVLGVGLAASLALDAAYLPGVYVDPSGLGWFRPTLALLAALALAHAWRANPWLVRARHASTLAAAAVLGGIVLLASPTPTIDVWYFQRTGAGALAQGVNPYALRYPNIYWPSTDYLSPALLSPDQRFVLANPYPPLSLILVVPATLALADPRWTMLAALLFSAWAIRRLGGGSAVAEFASLFLLLQPRTLFVLEQGWTEPLLLAAVLVAALAASALLRHEAGAGPGALRWRALAAAAAVVLSVKQYAPLLLVPLLVLVPRAARLRVVVAAVAGSLALALPFLLWDPGALVRSVVRFQFEQPFRPDALAWPAAMLAFFGVAVPTWPAFPAAGAVLAWAMRSRPSLSRAITGAALAWLVLVVLNKQAFCNYYWLAVGLLCAAVAVGSRDETARGCKAAG